MKILSRVLVVALVVVVVLGVAAGGAYTVATRDSFPQTAGTLKLPGLTGNVEIIRDALGVPHIYADTPEDLFRAQGFVHAQDRFFQMEFQRRIGQGRLAELFGEGALSQDKFIRTIGWMHTAAEEAKTLDAEMKGALESYAAGVNAYALPNAGKLGLEFKVLGLIGRQWSPEPWTPLNSLTWGKAMSYNLGGNMDQELGRMILIERGGQALADLILPPYPADMPVIVRQPVAQNSDEAMRGWGDAVSLNPSTPYPLISSSAESIYALHKSVQNAIGLSHDPGIGSNNWVVAGSRSATGKPLLANDPHLGLQMPSIWYINGLHCRVVNDACPYDVVGVSFPGTPGVILGHNARIAWGVTNTGPDTQDFFIERPNPQNANEFEYKGAFEPAQLREEVIQVAGGEPVTLTVRVTRHGPIINDALDLKDAPPMAMQWAALEPGTLFKSVLHINKAQNWNAFREALRYWDTPAQNFVYADVDGNIGYQMPGNIPIRAGGDGRAPVDGASGQFDWIDRVPFDQLPSVHNPPEGYIVTANNAVVDATSYPHFLGADWDHGYRAKRIEQMILSRDKLSVEDMRLMHMDSRQLFADEVKPFLTFIDAGDPREADAVQRMMAWDGNCDANSNGCAIFEAFWREMAYAALDDEVGETLAPSAVGTGTHTQITLRAMLAELDSKWWDNINTPEKENRDAILSQALKRTISTLQARMGNDMNAWQWGKIHTVRFENQTLGRSGTQPIEDLFNRGPFPVAGGMGLVNAVGVGRDFSAGWGPSWRAVYDVGNWSNSLGIHTTGQSGHATHPHYDDMIQRWLKGDSAPLLWTRDDVLKNAASTLVLEP
jgi:penicillin amidase